MELIKFCRDLYKIPRSLTGHGVLKSLEYIQKYVPFKINKVKSGTKVLLDGSTVGILEEVI